MEGNTCYRQVVHLAVYFWFMSGCFNFSPCQLLLHTQFRRNIQEKMDTLGGRSWQLSLNGMAAEGVNVTGRKFFEGNQLSLLHDMLNMLLRHHAQH